jgi:hypothetical protein
MSTSTPTPREQAVKLFPDLVIFKEKELIANRFTGEEIELEPEAVAVYDLCMGAEQFRMWKIVRKCLDWFKEYYPKEYLVLLD